MKNGLTLLVTVLMLANLSACSNLMPGEKPPLPKNEQVALYQAELAIRYLNADNVERAKEKLLEAQKIAPNMPAVQYTTGYFLETTGQFKAAEEKYRLAISLKPSLGESHNNYGAFLCRRARYPEAEKQFLLAAGDPDYTELPDVYENAGQCELLSKDKESAQKYFEKALDYNPTRTVSLLELAKLNLQAHNANKADEYFQRYRKVAPATATSLWVGIQIAAKLGQKDAVASYSLMLKNTFPKSQEYQKFQESHIYETAG